MTEENTVRNNPNAKEAIADRYLMLLKNKSADRITVRELTEQCGITRQAFYYHYPDVKGVMEYTIVRAVGKIGQESTEVDGDYASFRHIFNELMDIGPTIRRMMDSSFRADVEKCFVESIRNMLPSVSEAHTPDVAVRNFDRRRIVEFFSFGLAGYVIEHCGDENIDTDQECMNMYQLMVQYRSVHSLK